MTFAFDTGADGLTYRFDGAQGIRDRVADSYPADTPQATIDAALVLYCKAVVAADAQPAAVARRCVLVVNAAAPLAQRDPRLFLDLIAECADRLSRAV